MGSQKRQLFVPGPQIHQKRQLSVSFSCCPFSLTRFGATELNKNIINLLDLLTFAWHSWEEQGFNWVTEFPGSSVKGNARVCVSGEATAIWSLRH